MSENRMKEEENIKEILIEELDIEENEECEICGNVGIQWNLVSTYNESIIYKVCSNCLTPLVNYSLSKKEFFNLIKSGHDKNEFLIHSDFYMNGIALQPSDNQPHSIPEMIKRVKKAKEGIDYRSASDKNKECQCNFCVGYRKGVDEGIDADWDWVRVALMKMTDKKELQDTKFIPKLQKTIEDMSEEEFKKYSKLFN